MYSIIFRKDILMNEKKEDEARTHFQNESAHHNILVIMISICNQQ